MDKSVLLRRPRWTAIAAYALVAAATQMLWVTFAPVTTDAAHFWHVSENAIGWLSEVFPLIYVLLAIPFGLIADRRPRSALVIGTVLTAAGALIRNLDSSFSGLLIGQIVISVGQPLVLNAVNQVAQGYTHNNKQAATGIAIGTASLFFGILIAMLLGPLLVHSVGFSALLWVQTTFTIVASAWLFFELRVPLAYEGDVSSTPISGFKSVWRDRLTRLLALLLFIGFGLFVTVTTWLQALLSNQGITSVQTGIALAVMTAAGMIGAGVVPEWAYRNQQSKNVIILSLLVALAALVVMLLHAPYWLITVVLGLTGFFLLADLPIVLGMAERHFEPSQAGTAAGILLLSGNAGGIVLALLIQLVVQQTTAAMLILILATMVAFPFAYKLRSSGPIADDVPEEVRL